ncbi:MAG: glycoside hydrolase family 13 protein [Bacteroidetes bacterium]|nr:glycoside hydrolase family 13 protein [Bacteroidota bacterium]
MKNKTHLRTLIFLIIFLLTFSHLSFSNNISLERVEPMFWWAGMQNPDLQLLVHGENISQAEVSINYEGVKLKKVNKVENPNYLFLDIVVSKNAKPGIFEIKFKKNNKLVETYKYELRERNTKTDINKGFDASDAIYLLMPDRFFNGNPANDNIKLMPDKSDRKNPDGRHGGDIQGIINHVDYIENLGFTAVWMNPLLENNMPKYSYHGYAISDFYKIDKRLGTNSDYVNLVDSCHKHNLKVIMDMVFNHCGIESYFIKDLPMKDWIHQFPEFTRSNFHAPTVIDTHASDIDKDVMTNGWFDTNMADFNQKNKFLANYLIQNSIWWIEYSGIDGIRMDTYPYPDKDMMAEWTMRVFAEYPNFNIVGETWVQKVPFAAYWQKDSKISGNYNSMLPSLTDFPLYSAINKAFNEKEGWTEGMARLYYVLAQDFLYPNPNNLLVFVDNHDLDRAFSSLNKDIKKYKMAMAFLLTVRGIPQIYYGTEILMDGLSSQGHGFIRKDFPGGWKNDKVNAFTAKGRSALQNEAFDYLQNILTWRKNQAVISRGELKHFIPEDGVYVYFRYIENKTVMIILNNNEEADKDLNTKRFAECMKDYKSGFDIISHKQIDNLKNIKVAAKSAMIIELK